MILGGSAALKEQIMAAPKAPGVYVFHGLHRTYPLYIGKSVNIRARLLSHLRNPDEARLLKQTKDISYIPMAGEISALLLEAQMIKEQQPLFNKRLRKTRDTCSFVRTEKGLEIQYMDKITPEFSQNIYGLFKNQTTAKSRLRAIADEYRLCLSILGVEPDTKQSQCFRSAIKKCAGACCGNESVQAHNERLELALEQYKIAAWPYTGAIAVHENFGRLHQYHVLHHWHYHGSYKSQRGLKNYQLKRNSLFDADMYRILVKPILFGNVKIIELKNNA